VVHANHIFIWEDTEINEKMTESVGKQVAPNSVIQLFFVPNPIGKPFFAPNSAD
jgi:hypothetical protein